MARRLASLVQDAIARAPFERERPIDVSLPATLDLTHERNARVLWGPSGAHRRILDDRGLEFGSLYNFRYGWVSVGNLIARNVRVRGELCFSRTLDGAPYSPWMGVMLRSQGYFANMGHLALLRSNGEVARTEFAAGQHKDIDVGKIEGFDSTKRECVLFDVSIDEKVWKIHIGSVEHSAPISELPEVLSEGRIIVVSQFCWVGLRNLSIEAA